MLVNGIARIVTIEQASKAEEEHDGVGSRGFLRLSMSKDGRARSNNNVSLSPPPRVAASAVS